MIRTETLLTRRQAEARFVSAHGLEFTLPTKTRDYVVAFPGGAVERLSWSLNRSDAGERLFRLVIEA